ncbi:MAG: GDP-mannose 4,6-dehydratase [Deltaproteobacteria bacterium]|nr:GDP-mannose 4,6-dehydratase [Deltaproteobacteria bacterium]
MLLTGDDGFVGSHLKALRESVPFLSGGRMVDIRDADATRKTVAELSPDLVVHLAAQSFVPRSFEDPRETMDINFLGTLNLLGALDACGFRGRMLFVGSGDVYGLVPEEQLPIRESTPLRPRNPYAVSKVAAEALCYQWSQTSGFEILMVRPFNHIGPGQGPMFALSDFARQVVLIKNNRQLPEISVGDIDVSRDFTDVRDVVRAYLLLLEKGANGEVYNVCSGRERVVKKALEDMMEIAGVKASIITDSTRFRKAEQRRVSASNDKITACCEWLPEIPWENTLRDLLEYWEKNIDD